MEDMEIFNVCFRERQISKPDLKTFEKRHYLEMKDKKTRKLILSMKNISCVSS